MISPRFREGLVVKSGSTYLLIYLSTYLSLPYLSISIYIYIYTYLYLPLTFIHSPSSPQDIPCQGYERKRVCRKEARVGGNV
ncbi:hypothetical protein EJ05DRAFT_1952 [Pseudovirgaria hyperparasitica]|uniref:Uncharacterized protein n=1 Tax=Pseudovirgaria hyperparasitica TaxID=470096 RepID=A0A6A6WJ70_9PEZI|nr:uncharacterized protein EJ05DRAFT_1952 [Pseudovirgaria hyperparasitica]KAF2762439.1 hypothetical protein EJ05DRAFT_1952 [Pseudovirgaria hyperparasitica]